MRAQKITIAAVALAAGLSLTACGGSDDSASGKSDSASSSSSSSSSSTGGDDALKAKSGEGSMGGQVNTGTCKTENLSAGTFNGPPGNTKSSVLVTFKNNGEACSLKGFPGVDLKYGSSPSDTISAIRGEKPVRPVVLQSGGQTTFTLTYDMKDNDDAADVSVSTLVVTPPNETHSKTISIDPIEIPVVGHSPTDVTVDPVGAGKQ